MKLPLRSGKEVEIDQTYIASWRGAYPDVNIEAEIAKMRAWLLSNQSKRPVSQIHRFCNLWLSKQQKIAELHCSAAAIARIMPIIQSVRDRTVGAPISQERFLRMVERDCHGADVLFSPALVRKALQSEDK